MKSKEKREEIIANPISAILFVIPFAGEAVDGSLFAIRSALEMAEVVGEAGLLAYSSVQDLNNSFIAAGAGISRSAWSKAANKRRGVKADDRGKLGPVKDDLAKVNNARGGMCRVQLR